jgi:type II secretory pathway component PulJ
MRRSAGFTLLEVLAVVLLTGLVLGIALDFYVDLSRASNRAADHTRGVRRATAILDRMARDFESAVLVRKPDAVDPLAHPWVFLAESEYSSTGADHIKFVTRNHRPRSTASHESDLAIVSYTVRRTNDDQLELLRWSSPQLPEGLDRDFPYDSEDGSALLADGIAAFGVILIDEAGGQVDRWDSSQLIESSELPIAVEIEVAMATDDGSEPVPYRRRWTSWRCSTRRPTTRPTTKRPGKTKTARTATAATRTRWSPGAPPPETCPRSRSAPWGARASRPRRR